MQRKYITLLGLLFFAGNIQAQTTLDRSQLSLMVVANNTDTTAIHAYDAAISEINSALLEKGYKNTMDDKTRQENVISNRKVTSESSRSDIPKISIEISSVDILIETALHWMELPGEVSVRQLQMSLKAVDKYTSAVYATTLIHSKQRQFPSLEKAVQNTLKIDGLEQFEKFLAQLDRSYAIVLKEGRSVNMQFEINNQSQVRFSDRVDKESLSDKIEDYVRKTAFNGQYKIIGEAPSYMNVVAQAPVIDKDGRAVTPSWYLGRGVKNYFYDIGYDVQYVTINNLLKFVIKKR